MKIFFSGAIPSPVHQRGATALLGIFDTELGQVVEQTTYHPPPELHAPGQKVQFTGFSFVGTRLYVCTHNAVLRFDDWPPREPASHISLPGFNDLHHCLPWEGGLVVANTGLETVDLVSLDGVLKERWDVLGDVPDARAIDPQRDYRLIPDTKPHLCHPNHVFLLGGELWVTRLRTQDAICIGLPDRRILFPEGMPHDGSLIGEDHVFTTVNGHLIKIDPAGDRAQRSWRLADFDPDFDEMGWCRGVCADPENPDGVYVAFSMVRRPRWREIGYRIKHLHNAPPSRLCRFDLRERRLVDCWQVGENNGHVLFQIQPLDERGGAGPGST